MWISFLIFSLNSAGIYIYQVLYLSLQNSGNFISDNITLHIFTSQNFSKSTVEEKIIPELVLLFQDEELSVKEVAFESLTNILPKLDPG